MFQGPRAVYGSDSGSMNEELLYDGLGDDFEYDEDNITIFNVARVGSRGASNDGNQPFTATGTVTIGRRRRRRWQRLRDACAGIFRTRRLVDALLLIMIAALTVALIVERKGSGPAPTPPGPDGVSVRVLIDDSLPKAAGRLVLYIIRGDDTSVEPRNLAGDDQDTAQIFAQTVTTNDPARRFVFTAEGARGYPRASLADLEPGNYVMQAQLLLFKTYNRSVNLFRLPPIELRESCVSPYGNDGQYSAPIGTQFSSPVAVAITGGRADTPEVAQQLEITIDKVESSEGKQEMGCAGAGRDDSEYIRTLRMKSDLLTAFWGEAVYITACVLLPFGFDSEEHKDARYPLMVAHGHYSPVFAPCLPPPDP